MEWEQLLRSLASIGVECERLQEEFKRIASGMAISLSEAMNAIQLAFAGAKDYLDKIEYTPKRSYRRVMDIKPTKPIILNKKTIYYYHRGGR